MCFKSAFGHEPRNTSIVLQRASERYNISKMTAGGIFGEIAGKSHSRVVSFPALM